MSSHRDPMWFCHECHAEMRPLMIPDPHCASCRGTFVELMDDPSDDPRREAFPSSLSFLDGPQNPGLENEGGERPPGGMPNILEALSNLFAMPRDHDHGHPVGTPPSSGNVESSSGLSGGLRVVINTPSGTRSVRFGGSNTLGSGNSERGSNTGVPLLSEFLASNAPASNPDPNQPHQGRRAPAPLLASYLLSNLLGGRGPGRDEHGGMGMFDPFEMMARGRFGDYVVNEQALQNIMNELMANGAQQTDPPASEEVIESLPRIVLDEAHPLANDSCSICHEPFNPALAASADAFPAASSSLSEDTKDDGPSLVGVTLPCDHTFHEECILPWMRMKSTCPVCRKSVLPPATETSAGASQDQTRPTQARRHSSGGEGGSRLPGGWEDLD